MKNLLAITGCAAIALSFGLSANAFQKKAVEGTAKAVEGGAATLGTATTAINAAARASKAGKTTDKVVRGAGLATQITLSEALNMGEGEQKACNPDIVTLDACSKKGGEDLTKEAKYVANQVRIAGLQKQAELGTNGYLLPLSQASDAQKRLVADAMIAKLNALRGDLKTDAESAVIMKQICEGCDLYANICPTITKVGAR